MHDNYLSLLEGRVDNYIVIRLGRSLNTETLKENLKGTFINYFQPYGLDLYDNSVFNNFEENSFYETDEKSNKSTLILEAGFKIYHLLKFLMENDDLESQDIVSGKLEQLRKLKNKEYYKTKKFIISIILKMYINSS